MTFSEYEEQCERIQTKAGALKLIEVIDDLRADTKEYSLEERRRILNCTNRYSANYAIYTLLGYIDHLQTKLN